MHSSVMGFVSVAIGQRWRRDGQLQDGLRVLEVGGLDVNGSVRGLFDGCESYWSVDMREGRGVDQVVNAHDLASQWRCAWDVVVCTEMLEHDDAPWESVAAMATAAKIDGTLLLTCRGYDQRGCFPVHDHPDDLWRFSVEGVKRLLEGSGWQPESVVSDPEAPGVLAVAKKLW